MISVSKVFDELLAVPEIIIPDADGEDIQRFSFWIASNVMELIKVANGENHTWRWACWEILISPLLPKCSTFFYIKQPQAHLITTSVFQFQPFLRSKFLQFCSTSAGDNLLYAVNISSLVTNGWNPVTRGHAGPKDIDPADLNDLMKIKNTTMLKNKFNGISELAKSLETNLEHGIKKNDIERRKSHFGSNTSKKPSLIKGFFRFLWEAFNNTTIIILILCAALSIKENEDKQGWDEGYKIFAILILVFLVFIVTNIIQERQFYSLLNTSNDKWIDVMRQGRRQKVSTSDVVVGDVVILDIGYQIPANGLLITGHSLLVDESMTGEIDPIEIDANTYPFLFSGSKVAKGFGKMLVTSVGLNTTRSTTSYSNEKTPLQSRINKLTSSIAKIGIVVAIFVPIIMLIRHFTGYTKYKNAKLDYKQQLTDTMDKLKTFTRTLMASAEDINVSVTLTLAYCRKKMISDHVMVKKLSACETMGSVTTICTGKTGLLTMNQMKVTKFWTGLHHIEDDDSSLDANLLELFHQGVGLNTSGSVYNSETTPEYSCSPTEKAILSWAVKVLGMDMEKMKQESTILHAEIFNSEKKRSGVSIKKKEDDSVHVHWKGAAEMVLAMCSNYYLKNGVIKTVSQEEKAQLEKIIQGMAASGLRCIAFAHKQKDNEDATNYKKINEEGLTLLGIVGITDPCRPGAKEAINACKSAGVEIKMITGDNVFTAKAIATQCGILATGEQVSKDEVIEGDEFRNYTDAERMRKVENIRIMARSTPSDKLLMVECLKKKGRTVAVTGHDSNDAPALKEADVGLSMGIHGTDVAKASSDIVILDDDFASVVKTLRWGRCAYNNIQKFVQFQLTVNIAGLFINFVAAAFATEAPLTVVQLLWVNIIMDTLGSLALATEQPDIELMHSRPVRRDASLITNVMWRNILAQSVYQVTVLLIFHFRGRSLFDVNMSLTSTIIFNTFVICQVFNLFNSRNLEKRNVLKDLHKNRLFLGIIGVTLFIQVVMVEYLHNFADTEKLNMKQWGICIAAAALTWPIGWFVKLIPVLDRPFLSFVVNG